eukprot:7391521-Prymnesium_polylepis.3
MCAMIGGGFRSLSSFGFGLLNGSHVVELEPRRFDVRVRRDDARSACVSRSSGGRGRGSRIAGRSLVATRDRTPPGPEL